MIRRVPEPTSIQQLQRLGGVLWPCRYWVLAVVVLSASALWLRGSLFPDRFRQSFERIEMGMTLKQVEKQIDPATYSDDDSWGQTIFNGTQHVWQGKGRWILVRFTADGRACSKEYGVKATNQVFMTRLENWLRKVVGR